MLEVFDVGQNVRSGSRFTGIDVPERTTRKPDLSLGFDDVALVRIHFESGTEIIVRYDESVQVFEKAE